MQPDDRRFQPYNNNPNGSPMYPPVQPGMPPVGYSMQQPIRSTKKHKLLLAAAVVSVLLVGGGAAAYAAVIVPNKPENLWKTALSRTSIAYDTLVEQGSTQAATARGITGSGDYKIEGPYATDGTLAFKTYDQNATFKFDMGVAGSRVNIEGRVLDAANSSSPDLYVKASGIKSFAGLVGEDYGPLLNQFDNQWISADHTLFDQLASTTLEADGGDIQELTDDDAVAISKAVGEVNREYLFSAEPDKQVLTIVQKVGFEEQDDRQVYHFKAGLHKEHTKEYVKALVSKLQASPLGKMFGDKQLAEVINQDKVLATIDKYKESDTADVYVDKSTKLIRTVRIADTKSPKEYLEFKVPYTGGDTIPFMVNLVGRVDDEHPDKLSTVSLSQTMNKTSGDATTKLSFDMPSTSGGQNMKGAMNLKTNVNNAALDAGVPADAVPITELLGGLFSGLEMGADNELLEEYSTEL